MKLRTILLAICSAALLAAPAGAETLEGSVLPPLVIAEDAVAADSAAAAAAPVAAEAGRAAPVTAAQLSAARTKFFNASETHKTYAVRTKEHAQIFSLEGAEANNRARANALTSANNAFTAYKNLAVRAGKWAPIRVSMEEKHALNQWISLVGKQAYDLMARDAFLSSWVAGSAFQAEGKSTVHATATALDVLRAITRYGAAPRDWAGKPSLYRRIALESSGDRFAQNGRSSAYGRFQFLNQTWGTVGGSKTSDGVLQSVYGLRYIAQRYGHPDRVPASGSY